MRLLDAAGNITEVVTDGATDINAGGNSAFVAGGTIGILGAGALEIGEPPSHR